MFKIKLNKKTLTFNIRLGSVCLQPFVCLAHFKFVRCITYFKFSVHECAELGVIGSNTMNMILSHRPLIERFPTDMHRSIHTLG